MYGDGSHRDLGSGNGEAAQSFFTQRRPVLQGETIEVRELDGQRAAVELPMIARESSTEDYRVERAPNGTVVRVWVRWRSVPNFYKSGPSDRHYVIERTTGRLLFAARPVPPGADNVQALVYHTGGGAAGNVPAGAINQLLGGIPYVSGVSNPRAGEGGATQRRVRTLSAQGRRRCAIASAPSRSLTTKAWRARRRPPSPWLAHCPPHILAGAANPAG